MYKTYIVDMLTHSEIITRIGPVSLSESISEPTNTIYQWRRNNSIPSAHWKAITEAGLATYEELAEAAALRRQTA